MKFTRIGRTAAIGLIYNLASYSFYASPKVREQYRVNINKLFDLDEPFLYKNDHFKGLVRRINAKHNHLINSAFEIDRDILAANKPIDDWYNRFDQMEDVEKRIIPARLTVQCNSTFNIGNSVNENPFNTMIEKYEAFFKDQ